MAEVIDFFSERKKLEQKTRTKIREDISNSPEWQTFLEYCQNWKEKKAELCREEFLVLKGKGEIL